MSEYWREVSSIAFAVSSTALVLNPEESAAFEKKYLAETFNKGKEVTMEDIQELEENGISSTPFFRPGCRDELLKVFPTFESILDLDVEKMSKNLFYIMMYDKEEFSGGTFINRIDEHKDIVAGSFIIFSDKSTHPEDLLVKKNYNSYDEIISEFKEKMSVYLPDDFEWESHIGFFQCVAYA